MRALNFDWELVSGAEVLGVIGTHERKRNDGSLTWGQVAIILSKGAIVLSVNADTDEVIVDLQAVPEGAEWLDIRSVVDVVGLPLGWCWVLTNYLGYSDGFALAFGQTTPDALQPKVNFVVESSVLTCFQMAPVG